MPVTVVTGRNAAEFAEKYNPVVIQYTTGNDPRDNIEPFYAGPFVGSKDPYAYYAVKRDAIRRYTIAYYHWYHRLDWGGKGDFLGGNIDKHPGDFEGCCFCIPDDKRERAHMLTRSHHHILHNNVEEIQEGEKILLESKGHGCRWGSFKWTTSCRIYCDLDLIPLYNGEFYSSVAADMQRQFKEWGTVDWPDAYEDMQTKLRRIEHRGDYWHDPLGLIDKMERMYP